MKLASLTQYLAVTFLIGCGEALQETHQETSSVHPKVAKLQVPAGFRVEHLYSPAENDQGSWVAMTFDDQGRLITSDQYGALYRIEVPPVGQSSVGSDSLFPKVEPIKVVGEAVTGDSSLQMGYAQGLLWAFNSLYVMVNHREPDEDFGKSSGLYRLQDTNDDDQFDQITLLKKLEGSGEHGSHSIVLGPDGQSLYIIAGNHTDVPEMNAYRLPPVWQHDNLFPLIKDPRGHANDRMAPGGWIARTDSLGQYWELVAGGFRNAFDVAFNQVGDMFTYDSDMEWDLGMPWYRPTRICHVTSGAEFGWRTGSGKWSPAYPDNLPAVLNIGQGSPTGVLHGHHSLFPPKYQNALFAFDWSFGMIYAVHLQPEGASYTAAHEEFISGMPLPLTDGVFGPDGAMYFMTGGRRLDSDLYRVYYDGEPTVALAAMTDNELPEAHQIRRNLEAYHTAGVSGGVEAAWPYLNHPDRFVRYAARLAVEHAPITLWQARVLAEQDPAKMIQGAIALARYGDQSQQTRLLNRLCGVDYRTLSDEQKGDMLRAIELALARAGEPTAVVRQTVVDYLNPYFPAETAGLNASLSKLLVFLNAPEAIETTLALLEQQRMTTEPAPGTTNSADLILRNPQYGMDIARMLKDVPPAQQTYYATVLSEVASGWTTDQRERYFRWFYRAFDFEGGNSYVGFIDKARRAALAHVPKNQFNYYNTISGDSLLANNGKNLADVPEPEGPWRNWESEEAMALLDSVGLTHRDYEVGRNMFVATRCATCHSMRGEGGIIGPNLTQLGTRFSAEDMLTAIVEPDDAISDQYVSTVLYLNSGQSVVGKLIDQDETTYYLSQNPFAPEVIREVAREHVARTQRATVSSMPPHLINPLNENELLDLIAYLMAGGDPNHTVYQSEPTSQLSTQ